MTLSQWKKTLIELDNFGQRWKTFLFLALAIAGFYILPEGKLSEFVSFVGVTGIGVVRYAKIVADKQ